MNETSHIFSNINVLNYNIWYLTKYLHVYINITE